MIPLARHTLLELHGCPAALLANSDALRPLLLAAVRAAGGTVVTEVFHNFSPHGVSGVIVIAESHVAIHTWPEHAYAAVDLFTCGVTLDAEPAVALLQEALGATTVSRQAIPRGLVGSAR